MRVLLLLLILAVCSARAQNAEPNRRLHQPSSSPVATDFYAQPADHFWDRPPEGGSDDPPLGSRHGNEKPAVLDSAQSSASTYTRLSAHSASSPPLADSRRQMQSSNEDRKNKRRRAQQWWRAGGEPEPRENLVNVGGRNRMKKKQSEPLQGFGRSREERRRRRRNRKRARSRLGPRNRRTHVNHEDTAIGTLMKALKQQLQPARPGDGSLEVNPLNLSMTSSAAEINGKPLTALRAASTSSYPSQLSAESPRLHKPLPVEREFSRQVEREFAKSGGAAALERPRQQEDNADDEDDEDDAHLAKFNELEAPSDPERMLGYSRTDEDLPILDLENEVLQRTINDYNAYVSSSFAKSSRKDHSNSRQRNGSTEDAPLTPADDEEQMGDLSCVNGTFLPAPFVRHAVIKYFKSSKPDREYLEADYECESGYELLRSNESGNGRLLCHERRWIGRLPACTSSCRELACEQLCRVVDDRAECSCRQGFRLGPDGATCIDVDECEANGGRGPCAEACRNLEGGFECKPRAPPATEGPCERDNAGCSHTCLASLGRVFCLCPDGFMLEDDWKTCQDVNECAVSDLQTELCRYGCINTPGSYHCAPAPHRALQAPAASADCQPGYQLHPLVRNCIDVDECATNNGGCSEVCENTEGSFFCACEGDERVLSADRRSCVVAEQRFEKMDREAAALNMRFHQAVSCSALNPAGRGYLMCSDSSGSAPSPTSAAHESSEEADSAEDSEDSEEEEAVERTRAPIRPGTKCHLKCPNGYELHGEYELSCRADGTWDGPKHGECLRYSKPRLDCPKDVLAELPAGRDEAFVTYEQPSTDLDWFRYVRSKPSWGTRLEASLKLGLHQVSFFARHPVSKKQASCTLNITVQEGQAPKVDNCPSDIQVTGKNGSAISWQEPVFTDNVKVTRVTSSQSPGQTFSLGGHKVEYEAADEAGWTTKCIFTVVLRPV